MGLTHLNRAVVNFAQMCRIGGAQPVITLDTTIARRVNCCSCIGQRHHQIRMGRIAGNRLAHVDQRALVTIIRGAPIQDDRNRRSGQGGNRRIEHGKKTLLWQGKEADRCMPQTDNRR